MAGCLESDDATVRFDDDVKRGEEKRALLVSVEKVYFVKSPHLQCVHMQVYIYNVNMYLDKCFSFLLIYCVIVSIITLSRKVLVWEQFQPHV